MNELEIPKPYPSDLGMTVPNLQRAYANRNRNTPRELPPDDFDSTNSNMWREKPSDADFDMTMSNTSGGGGYTSSCRNESDYGATMTYIKLSEQERHQYEDSSNPTIQSEKEQRHKIYVPPWFWVISGSLGFLALFFIVGFIIWYLNRPTGFVVIVRNAPVGSSVFVDNQLCGERSGDAIKCNAARPGTRTIKVTKAGYSDSLHSVTGNAGDVVPVDVTTFNNNTGTPPPCDGDPDARVAAAECGALVELDKLKPGFTADDLVRVLNLQIINFESNKYDIPEKRKTFLRRAAEKFNQLPATTIIEIGGHTDSQGSVQDNMKLSENRANAVKNFLSGANVNDSKLRIKPYGASKPIADNNTDDGKFKNRRIHYTVISG